MFNFTNNMKELVSIKKKRLKNPEQKILEEATKFTASYAPSGDVLAEDYKMHCIWEKSIDDRKLADERLFSEEDLKRFCIRYRLTFKAYIAKEENVPYPALLALEAFNKEEKKKINTLYICSFPNTIPSYDKPYLAFIKTNSGKYFLLYESKKSFSVFRKIKYFPVRNFETVLSTVIVTAGILAVTLPTRWIWLPEGAPYWGTYRIAAFFHILIFLMGFTTYGIFSFSGYLSSQLWNKFLK